LGFSLVAAADPSWIILSINILKVAIGLGMVIFVHELGHFLVAKLCGVKCEKFYLGFDIAGWKLAKFVWGETEYGIGILPLGGYVKMLGQEDNPARLREEIERAKAQSAADPAPNTVSDHAQPAVATASAEQTSDGPSDPPIDVQKAQQALYDPRSYLAKSVPKRMAIISAGVVMNVVFAFLAAVVAYGIGVQQLAPVVGVVTPGDGAWQAGIHVGDRIVQVGNTPVHTYIDLRSAISLGDSLDGAKILVERPGRKEPYWVTVKAEKTGLAPTIGIISSMTTTLNDRLPAYPGTPAAECSPPFRGGDRIVAIDGQPVRRYVDIYTCLATHAGKTLQVTMERAVEAKDQADTAERKKTERLTIAVAPALMWQLGLSMQMGPIVAVQADSPAEKAGLLRGDVIVSIDGEPVGDPMTLPDRLRRLAGKQQHVQMKVQGREDLQPRSVEVGLQPVDSFDSLRMPYSPMSAPALGIAYKVPSRVEEVLPGGPAAKAGIKPGDVVVQAVLIPPGKERLKELGLEKFADEISPKSMEIDLKPGNATWPYLMNVIQEIPPGTQVQLLLESGGKVTLNPVQAADWFNPDRGFVFQALEVRRQADSFTDAVRLGARETWASLTVVFRTVQRLLDNQVSPKALSGPIGIAQFAYDSAARGTADLLIFLTLLSANLAVLNFLPIPVLDGGHMVFLAYEGSTGNPPNERVQLTLTYLGLLLLLTLMVWVVGLDVGLISRQ
jgi:regulator of sigma E protease